MYNAARSFALSALGPCIHCHYNGKVRADLRQASQHKAKP